MTQTYTPGPWEVDSTWGLIMGPDKAEVAAIHTGESMHNVRPNGETAAANATLISQAPALLEALEALTKAVHPDVYRIGGAAHGTATDVDEAHKAARIAIQRARGEE